MASWQETFLSLPIDARRRYAELYCRKGMRAKVGRLPPFNSLQIPKKSKQEILDTDVESIFKQLGLEDHLSPTRRNGFFAMLERIESETKKMN